MVGGRADCGGGVMTLHSFDNKRKSSDAAEMKPTDARIHDGLDTGGEEKREGE